MPRIRQNPKTGHGGIAFYASTGTFCTLHGNGHVIHRRCRSLSALGTFSLRNNSLKPITMDVDGLRFECQHCGIFCCRLGGPVVSEKDLKRLKRSIPEINRLTKTVRREPDSTTVLVSKPNGECILFLRKGKKKGVCSKYRLRPDVCRTYPIQLVREDDQVKVSLLPCIGLSRNRGRIINGRFIEKHLKSTTVA